MHDFTVSTTDAITTDSNPNHGFPTNTCSTDTSPNTVSTHTDAYAAPIT